MAGPRRLALLTRAPFPQELPRVNPQLMAVIKLKSDCIFTYAFGRSCLDGGFEHGQRSWRWLGRLSGLLVRLGPGLIAQRTGTSIAQEWKRIMRHVPVLPLDIQASTSAQIYFHRFRVAHDNHEFSIAQPNSLAFLTARRHYEASNEYRK